MQKFKTLSGMAMATAAALMFSATPMTASAADAAKVKCEGGNACKGKSACHTATSGCQGQNSCKGKGYVMVTKAECDAALAKMKSEKK